MGVVNIKSLVISDIVVKIGLEIHQQLDTHKLFCMCPSKLSDRADFKFSRRLRPVISEMGQLDRAAIQERRKGRTVEYCACRANSCAVEWDEEPPHEMNREALETALQFSRLMHARPVDEIQVMRKILIDGSAVSGFQRTALVATGGEVSGIPVQAICLEEDSARPVKHREGRAVFNVDRLGTPLIEIATAPEIASGEQAKKVAKAIGEHLRMLKVKRGVGTIRQDINISTPEGARVEIKGVQDLDLIPKIVDFEISRQQHLAKLAPRLKKVKFTKPVDVSKAFTKTASKIFSGKKVYAVVAKNASGLFSQKIHKGKHLGREIAEYVKAYGFGGFIHTDEDMKKYKIDAELASVKKRLKATDKDLVILAAGSPEPLNLAVERVHQLSNGVTEDTRRANLDGSSSFLRPLPTGARMYPETDVPPIRPFRVKDPETPEKRLKMLKKILPEQIAVRLHTSPDYCIFRDLGSAPILGFVLTQQVPAMRRAGKKVTREHLQTLLKVYGGEKGSALTDLLNRIVSGEKILQAKKVGESEARAFVKQLIKDRKEYIHKNPNAVKGLMGVFMKKFRGKYPGKLAAKIIQEELDNL